MVDEEVFLKTSQVALYCRVTTHMVRRWKEAGRLTSYPLPDSNQFRFARSEVLAFMKKHKFPIPPALRDVTV